MSTSKRKNCFMPLGKDGGCYNPYCCDPQDPLNVKLNVKLTQAYAKEHGLVLMQPLDAKSCEI